MSIKVSIIIPVYNVEKYISKCLESVVNQSYKNLEIIIINDGSPDKSHLIIDEFSKKDKRIKVINQENLGLSEARNTGMDNATGYYYYFLDSDDFIELDTIQYMIQKSYNYDIIIANWKKIDNKGEIIRNKYILSQDISFEQLNNSDFRFDYFFEGAYGTIACNKLYKADFLINNNLKFQKNKEIYAEDLLFNMKCIVNKPLIKILDKYTYFYFQHEKSITNTYKDNLTMRFSNLIKDFSNYCLNKNEYDKYNDILCYTFCIAVSNSCLNEYKFKLNNFKKMRHEISTYYEIIIASNVIDKRYLNKITNQKWKYFYIIFLSLIQRKNFNLATLLQFTRFLIQQNLRKF